MVRISAYNGEEEEFEAGVSWTVRDEGELVVYNAEGIGIVSYASGWWIRAELVEDEADV
jgi:hypothetical protein